MSRGPSALIGYLGLAVLLMVVVTAAVALIFGAGPTDNPITAAYNALLHTIDSGTVAGDTGTGYIILGLFVTAGGIVIFSAFIGVLATTLDERLAELRKGRSSVLEKDHTLILGWSDTIFTILSELSIANESERDPVVVILAEKDKVEMEDAIRERIEDMRGTKIVCRTGSPINLRDLAIVNHHDCRSIIVLSPEEEDPDTSVIKTILALTRGPDRREEPYRIVAEIEHPSNIEAAYLVGGDEAVIVDKGDTIARLIVQASRQAGAAAVYVELLDFDGTEIYFRDDQSFTGRTYGEALLAYEECAVMGVRTAQGVTINPDAATVIGAGDELIALADDDSVLVAAQAPTVAPDEARVVRAESPPESPRRALIIGVNRRTAPVLRELNAFSAPGSEVVLLGPDEQRMVRAIARAGTMTNLTTSTIEGVPTDRSTLEAVDVPSYDHVIVMSDDDLVPQRADARTLVTLLHLRELTDKADKHVTIASEMLDEGNRELAQVTKVDDVIVSEQIVSLMLAQISENEHLAEVFDVLFSAEGSEVYLRDASTYVTPGEPVSFATLVAAARERGETAIGYRDASAAEDAAEAYGVRISPPKSALFPCTGRDKLIVLAED
ncbi:CASTOR/POLLUX-related putative ion channel [Paraconexibacter algicola]|uniref:Potassium transporter TrkA n=1 Tax=Paraconexibacter algicola TaxID=2133960 RepID=A0A2T4UCQ6_9ACTN|nr:NAD-binding protein [Paraconexibacter algicola]PTL55008.1 potassium transporter TrkA [Paraconexibacter algicola]